MYYRLTYTASSVKGKKGDCFLNGHKPVSIGQSTFCDIQIPDSERFEPMVFASILSEGADKGWYVVKRSDYCHLKINGIEVAIAQTLNHGDLLSISDGTVNENFKFEIFNDGHFDEGSGLVYRKHQGNRHFITVAVILSILAFGVAAYSMFFSNRKNLQHTALSKYNSSIFQITVDSVYLTCDTLVDGRKQSMTVEAIELQQVFVGTAFLCFDIKTGDTLFVTARHCVEPWINDDKWDGVSDIAKMSPEVRLATKAETFNRHAGYDKYILKAHCILSKGLERYEYYSTDFFMNKNRDLVMRLGAPDKPIYWRTIIPIAHRRDMELGDFAYLKAKSLNRKENDPLFSLADWDEIVSFAKSGDRDIAVMGFPINDNDANDATVVYGNCMDLEINDSIKKPIGCLKMYAPINRGNSGGPVIAIIDNKLKVIGIVSKADGRANQGLFWSVPITEVTNMHRQGDTIENTETFRR